MPSRMSPFLFLPKLPCVTFVVVYFIAFFIFFYTR
jgi:hypothetical protein